jgi:hypothetical protein
MVTIGSEAERPTETVRTLGRRENPLLVPEIEQQYVDDIARSSVIVPSAPPMVPETF